MNSPKFGKLYVGNWPYDSGAGVGLRFDGLPTDRGAFINFLMQYSCHPKAGSRIYERILANGFDLLTVMYHLPFEEIAEGLKDYGVIMSIIPPMIGWTNNYSDGPYPEDFVLPVPHLRRPDLEDVRI